ncbi:hypothetical protein HYV79_01875 [Candidatus Woesearchaeota archaeon]|nr:hypothetical protein [Candidatus Woesearchaeota archaeon]
MILIDFNEPREIIKYFHEHKLCRLNCDYLIEGIAVERKTFSDFLQSVYNKKLFNQLLKTKSQYAKTILVIEGLIDPNLLTNPKLFYSTLQYITLQLGIPVIFSQSLENTAEAIKILNNSDNQIFFYKNLKIFPKRIPVAEKILQCVEGIGPKKAKAIIRKYGNVANIINSEDSCVEGANKKIIKKIKKALT